MGRLNHREQELHDLGLVLMETINRLPFEEDGHPDVVLFLERMREVAKSGPPYSNAQNRITNLIIDAGPCPF
jgi:hypothetical protein